jgi:hypothetical protein
MKQSVKVITVWFMPLFDYVFSALLNAGSREDGTSPDHPQGILPIAVSKVCVMLMAAELRLVMVLTP